MRSMEFSGKSVDEAIFIGLNEMGVTIDEVEIETIQSESKGLFGIGAKSAVVRLTEREVPLVMEMEQVFRKEEAAQQRRAERTDRRGGSGRGNRGDGNRGDGNRGDGNRGDGNRGGNRDGGNRGDGNRGGGNRGGNRDGGNRGDDERRERVDEPRYDYSEELAKATPCAVFLTELLEKMNVPCRVLAANTDNGLRLCIDADTMGLLIGRRGETLDALQYLVSLYANHGRGDDGYLRVTLDTEGYRFRREETLCRLARKNALQVRQTGRAVAMEPMNPYERRILHSALQNFGGVSTHSEGEEPNRHVVITPANN